MDVKIFAKKLKEKRLQKGFTQEALAKRLFVTKKAVSRWETGRGLPDAALLPELASALDVTIDELFNAEETEILDYYREFHQRVDEHTLYVQSYERQRSYLNFFKILVGALICVIVALAIVASNYHKAYTQASLLPYL